MGCTPMLPRIIRESRVCITKKAVDYVQSMGAIAHRSLVQISLSLRFSG